MEHAQFERLLAALEGLDDGQRAGVRKALDGPDDFARVVSLLEDRFLQNPICPHCGCGKARRWSRESGLKRLRCKACSRTYNCLTGTPLAGLHKKGEWLGMASALKDSISVAKTAVRCGVAVSTAFRWRHRFLKAAASSRPERFEDVVEADETYFLESFKGQRGGLSRKPRKRGGKASKPGLSAEQIPVLVAKDRFGHVLDAVLKDRTIDSALAALAPALGLGNVLCVDEGKALRGAGKKIGVPLRVIPKGRRSVPGSPVFHIQGVNAYHSRLKEWIKRFHGVATKYLHSYLGWRRLCEDRDTVPTSAGWLLSAVA